MKNESLAKKLLNHFEVYAGAGNFYHHDHSVVCAGCNPLLFGHAVTWAEEVATIPVCVDGIFRCCGRRFLMQKTLKKLMHFVEMLPFKAKKTLLIISNVIFLAFSLYIIFPMMSLVNNYCGKECSIPDLKIPKALSYVVMHAVLPAYRNPLVQEIIRLSKEKEKELGVSSRSLILRHWEKEAEELARQKKGGNK